ncbi:TPA: hypothetical protein QCX53_005576 [Bacillus cereus]|nr:hypothetical protein [Bacillus cereus]
MSEYMPRISKEEFEKYINTEVKFLELFNYPIRASFSVFMIVFSLMYLIFPKGISIIVSLFAITTAFFFSAFKAKNKKHKLTAFVLVISFILLSILNFGATRPHLLNVIFGLTVVVSVFIGLLLTLLQFFQYISKSKYIFVVFLFFITIVLIKYFFTGTFPLLLENINTVIKDEESALSKIGTSGTTLSFGIIIMDSLRRKIKWEKQKSGFSIDSTYKLIGETATRTPKK